MKNNKLIQLFKTFSAQEMNDFGKFLNSPFHNENLKMRQLYDHLKKYYPGFEHIRLTKENIFRKLYSSDEKYDDKKLRARFSDMMGLAEEYLALVHLKKSPVEFKRHTLYEFVLRGLDMHFNKKNKEIRGILDKTKIKDIDYLLDEYYYTADTSVFFESRKLLGKRKSVWDELSHEIDLFLKFVSANMMLYYSLLENWKENINYNFEYKFYDSVMKFVRESDLSEYPLIKALYLRLKIIENENDDSLYYELKELYLNSAEVIEREHRIRIGTILYNDGLRRYMLGKDEFENERFELMKYLLEEDLYCEEDEWLSREQYFNYVAAAISLGELDWAEKFVVDYTVKVDPAKRTEAHSFVKGLISYHKKDYDAALVELSKIKGGDYVYHLRIKTLHSKIYFELMDYEKVLLIIDALKHYLYSNPIIPESMKKRYVNYINVLYKLTKLKYNENEYSALKLIEEIKNFTPEELTTHKQWLLEMAMELKTK